MEFDELVDSVQPTEDGVLRAVAGLAQEGVSVSVDAAALAAEMQMSAEAVEALAEEMGLGWRVEPECYLPTPEEIRLETARYRAGWTQAERDARREGRPTGRLE